MEEAGGKGTLFFLSSPLIFFSSFHLHFSLLKLPTSNSVGDSWLSFSSPSLSFLSAYLIPLVFLLISVSLYFTLTLSTPPSLRPSFFLLLFPSPSFCAESLVDRECRYEEEEKYIMVRLPRPLTANLSFFLSFFLSIFLSFFYLPSFVKKYYIPYF
ncbi:unnamed protein product [Acanthosepion pharaonis]|uniref:Transmembrane protein n=1 Tax=Acanthosepion pharaonis TaxID=158019 RepID=A0A812ELJ6_ACAPH|nr:unnamed protein product [Sepia pharaonis]